ncbi:MAG: VPLPA-CTERM sorting domain-containing protein [Pseudomonadota bacterium]
MKISIKMIAATVAAGMFAFGAQAATIDPGFVTYKLSGGSKLVAQFDANGDALSWTVTTKAKKGATASLLRVSPAFGFTTEVTALLEDLQDIPGKANKMRKNSVLAKMFGKRPAIVSWTREVKQEIPDHGGYDDVAPVPLPAGGLLLLTAIGSLLLMRRKTSA